MSPNVLPTHTNPRPQTDVDRLKIHDLNDLIAKVRIR